MQITKEAILKDCADDVVRYVNARVSEAIDRIVNNTKESEDYLSYDFLSNRLCEIYSIHPKEIGKRRCIGLATDVVYSVIVMLKNHTKISNKQICFYLNKSGNIISRAVKEHRLKDEKIPHHKVYLKNYAIVEAEFISFIKSGFKNNAI